jgi:hypothetical protein
MTPVPTYWSLEVNENTPALFDSNNNTRVLLACVVVREPRHVSEQSTRSPPERFRLGRLCPRVVHTMGAVSGSGLLLERRWR